MRAIDLHIHRFHFVEIFNSISQDSLGLILTITLLAEPENLAADEYNAIWHCHLQTSSEAKEAMTMLVLNKVLLIYLSSTVNW